MRLALKFLTTSLVYLRIAVLSAVVFLIGMELTVGEVVNAYSNNTAPPLPGMPILSITAPEHYGN